MRANVSKHAQVAFGQKGVEGIFGINLEHPPFVDPYGHRRLLKAKKPHFCKSVITIYYCYYKSHRKLIPPNQKLTNVIFWVLKWQPHTQLSH